MTVTTRIIKNTGFLYGKMIITVFISLYTTKLILNSLGPSDFGIFNIVGGIIGMLGFLNSTMANASLRFMSFAEGEGCLDAKRKIFNVSFILHLAIAIVTVVLLLGVMYPLFNDILNIVPNRVHSAKIVYICLVVSTVLTIVNVPYDAVMNAHENMFYYSIIGILESLLRLLVAFACMFTSHDKLIVYGILMALIPLLTLSIMKIYCHKHYQECHFSLRQYWDVKLVKQIASFSGWNFLTATSSLFSAQGIGIVLNHFYGTVLNASQGIANQLSGQMSSFSKNMMKAVNPVIVKSAGAKNLRGMNVVTIASCKYSTYLTLIFAIPFMIEMPYILKIWLKDVPDWASLFCILQIIQTVICQMADSASTAVYAQGDIKGYAIYKSVMNAMPVLLAYLSLRLGGAPYWIYIPMIVIWAIGGNVVIIAYAKSKCGLVVKDYFKGVFFPVIGVSLVMFFVGIIPFTLMSEGLMRLIVTCCITTIGMGMAIFLFGMETIEKQYVVKVIDDIVRRWK